MLSKVIGPAVEKAVHRVLDDAFTLNGVSFAGKVRRAGLVATDDPYESEDAFFQVLQISASRGQFANAPFKIVGASCVVGNPTLKALPLEENVLVFDGVSWALVDVVATAFDFVFKARVANLEFCREVMVDGVKSFAMLPPEMVDEVAVAGGFKRQGNPVLGFPVRERVKVNYGSVITYDGLRLSVTSIQAVNSASPLFKVNTKVMN